MSRTKRGEKGSGFDYWGKRPLSGNCGFGPKVKKVSMKIERARAKAEIRTVDLEMRQQ